MEAPDISAVADFFRVSPWEAKELYQALGPFALADMVQRAEEEGAEPIIWASIDDSATRKDKDTHALEAMDWIYDHSASGKGQTTYCKGVVHVTLTAERCPFRCLRIDIQTAQSGQAPEILPVHGPDSDSTDGTDLVWQPLGLGDFRMQAYEAIEKWYAVLHLVLTFLQWRLHEAWKQGQRLRSLTDVIRQQRAEHARETLISACREAIQMGSIEPVLQRFIAAPVFG